MRPASIWQWPEILGLIVCARATCFAIYQCEFGADFPKPTRILANLSSFKFLSRSPPKFAKFASLPTFNSQGQYFPSTALVRTNISSSSEKTRPPASGKLAQLQHIRRKCANGWHQPFLSPFRQPQTRRPHCTQRGKLRLRTTHRMRSRALQA